MKYWLIKSEPDCYSLEDFKQEKITVWSGVRNYAARNNLKAMSLGDICLFYRSIQMPAIQGLCKVVKTAYPDPTDTNWMAVDLEFQLEFPQIIPLSTVKKTPLLLEMELVKNSRLSVQKVSEDAFEMIQELGHL